MDTFSWSSRGIGWRGGRSMPARICKWEATSTANGSLSVPAA
jgi:hypothetical protein